jgi:HAE1 family hydrophobic/amphiphilic exporter-1
VIGAPVGSVQANVAAALDAYPFPAGYRWEFGPSTKQNSDVFSSLTTIVVLAIILMYMLLAAQFESFALPAVILVAAPLAAIGIVASLLLTHRAFGLTALIGSLMLGALPSRTVSSS